MDPISIIVGFCIIAFAIVVSGVASLFSSGKVRLDRVLGVKTADAPAGDAGWAAISRFAGRQFVFWSFPVLLIGGGLLLVPLKTMPVLAFGAMALPGLCYLIATVRTSLFAARTNGR